MIKYAGQLGKFEAEVVLSIVEHAGSVAGAFDFIECVFDREFAYGQALRAVRQYNTWWRRLLRRTKPQPEPPLFSQLERAVLAISYANHDWVREGFEFLLQNSDHPAIEAHRQEFNRRPT